MKAGRRWTDSEKTLFVLRTKGDIPFHLSKMNLSLPAKKENLQKGLLHFPQHPRLRDTAGSREGSLAPGIQYAITQLEKHLRILLNSGPWSWRRLVIGAQCADLVALRLMLTLSDSRLLGTKTFRFFPAFPITLCAYMYVCMYQCMHNMAKCLWRSENDLHEF